MSQAIKPMKFDFTVEELPWEGARSFYKWWLDSVECKGIPSRKDFNPMKFARYLPTVMLTDVNIDPYKFVIRLAGSELEVNLGEPMEGKEIIDLRGGDKIHERFSKLVDLKKPYYALGLPMLWAHKDYSTYDVLMLPLSDDGVNINKLLTHFNFTS